LPEGKSDFATVAERATRDLNTSITYHHVDVRNAENLNQTVERIAFDHGRLDGLIAAAGIQQETTALDYLPEDADRMFGVNVTGVFMSAQAVARQMIRLKQRGSLVLIASMSGTVANRGLNCS
jgi:NAD(P)-dependent dehydrogenase (short-subunit alcohol dehydrogenase family)